jgi:hypothetical protein
MSCMFFPAQKNKAEWREASSDDAAEKSEQE